MLLPQGTGKVKPPRCLNRLMALGIPIRRTISRAASGNSSSAIRSKMSKSRSTRSLAPCPHSSRIKQMARSTPTIASSSSTRSARLSMARLAEQCISAVASSMAWHNINAPSRRALSTSVNLSSAFTRRISPRLTIAPSAPNASRFGVTATATGNCFCASNIALICFA